MTDSGRKPRSDFRAWIWRNGWSDSFGHVWVIDDYGKLSPWRTQIATAKRYARWLREIIKQFTCWHPQRVFNGAGKMDIPTVVAEAWFGKLLFVSETREMIPAVRLNYMCARCRKRSYVYTPDFDAERARRKP